VVVVVLVVVTTSESKNGGMAPSFGCASEEAGRPAPHGCVTRAMCPRPPPGIQLRGHPDGLQPQRPRRPFLHCTASCGAAAGAGLPPSRSSSPVSVSLPHRAPVPHCLIPPVPVPCRHPARSACNGTGSALASPSLLIPPWLRV